MALKLTAAQREGLDRFARNSNWNGHAQMIESEFLYQLGGLYKLTDQALADFFTEIIAHEYRGDLKKGWTVRVLRDGYYIHLFWVSPPGWKWGQAWGYSLADFAADCAKGNGVAKGVSK